MTSSQHVYEVRPRKDHRGVDLISDALPFGRLWSVKSLWHALTPYTPETNPFRRQIISRIVPQCHVAFADMLPTPRSVAICFVLLLGISSRLHAQAFPSPSPIYYLIEHVDVRTRDSLRGVEIGTQVELVQDFGDRLSVKSRDLEVEVDRKLATTVNGHK
jgi:hypothetical protein